MMVASHAQQMTYCGDSGKEELRKKHDSTMVGRTNSNSNILGQLSYMVWYTSE